MLTHVGTGEQVVVGRGMELVLGEDTMSLLSSAGRPIVQERPSAAYGEISLVQVSGRTVTVTFSTPGPGWQFAAIDRDAAAWAAEYLRTRQRAAQAAQAAAKPESIEQVGSRLAEMLADPSPQVSAAAAYLLRAAAALRATDLHISPAAAEAAVQVRVDGILHDLARLPQAQAEPLVAHLKSLAGLPAYISDSPQYGHISVPADAGDVAVRITTVPCAGGEAAALRILNPAATPLDIDELGLEDDQRPALLAAASTPGLVVFTGPAGAGKTTTMYAVVDRLCADGKRTVTVEAPPERLLTGAVQIAVDDLGGQWGLALQAALRLDPDVLLLGEIRDAPTAALAAHASLAGHTLLATMHASAPASVPVRLLQLDVPPETLASGLTAIVSQRLLRRVCDQCAAPDAPDEALLASLGLTREDIANARLMRGQGCAACMSSGYRGRVAAFEIWPVSERARELILARAPAQEFAELYRSEVAMTAIQAALRKALRGEVSLAEVANVFHR